MTRWLSDSLRLVAAASVVVFGIPLIALGIGALLERKVLSSWVLSPLAVAAFLGLIALVMIVFNRSELSHSLDEQSIRRLEESGMLISEIYHARRAFGVEEVEDEGPRYFIEIEDGRVLFLSGQYLYDYEPGDGQTRRFPCSEFVLRCHGKKGYTVDITCKGTVIEPETVMPPFNGAAFKAGFVPGDRGVIVNRSYDELKSELKAALLS